MKTIKIENPVFWGLFFWTVLFLSIMLTSCGGRSATHAAVVQNHKLALSVMSDDMTFSADHNTETSLRTYTVFSGKGFVYYTISSDLYIAETTYKFNDFKTFVEVKHTLDSAKIDYELHTPESDESVYTWHITVYDPPHIEILSMLRS